MSNLSTLQPRPQAGRSTPISSPSGITRARGTQWAMTLRAPPSSRERQPLPDQTLTVTTVTCSAGPFTYTGSPQTPCSVTVTGAGGLSLTPAASYVDNVDAGTATASYRYPGDATYAPSSDSENFIINRANAVVVVTPYSVTYDGLPHTATVTSITGVAEQTGATVGTVNLDQHDAHQRRHLQQRQLELSPGRLTTTTSRRRRSPIRSTRRRRRPSLSGTGRSLMTGTTHAGGSGTVTGPAASARQPRR